MEIIITTLKDTENKNTHYTEDSKDAKIKSLEFRNRQLEEENKLLLSMLAVALGNRTICIREESLNREPHFIIGENLGGDILISCR